MTKQLVFLDKDADIFWTIHFAYQRGRALEQKAPGIEMMRKERRIGRLLKSISEPDPEKTNNLLCPKCGVVVMARDPQDRRLLAIGGTIVLAQEDIDLLKERIDKGPWIAAELSEKMADAYDFLNSAPESLIVEDNSSKHEN